MAPFPLIKLGIVFFKQVSKPLANQIKTRAKGSEFFKKYICMPPAQLYHWYDINLRMRMLGIETKKVAKMNEEAAVALGADILGEAVILSVAIGGLVFEYVRRSKNDSEKEVHHQQRLSSMENKLSELEITMMNQSAQLLQLERLIHNKISPPSKSDDKSSPKPTNKSSEPSSTTTNKQPSGQAFSIIDQTSIQSSLIQMYPIDIVTFPLVNTLRRMHDSIVSSIRKTN